MNEKKLCIARWYGRLTNLAMEIIVKDGELYNSMKQNPNLANILTLALSAASAQERDTLTFLINKLEGTEQHLHVLSPHDTEVVKGMHECKHFIDAGDLAKLKEDHDFFEDWANAERKKKRKKKLIIFGIIALIVGAFAIYNLPYFREMRLWNEISETKSQDAISEYYAKFPDGVHYEEVLYIDIQTNVWPLTAIEEYYAKYPTGKYYEEVLYAEIKNNSQPVTAILNYYTKYPEGKYKEEVVEFHENYLYTLIIGSGNKLIDITNYFDAFPEGKHIDEVTDIYDSRWDNVFAQYNNIAKTKANSKDVAFIREMLQHMRENRIHDIVLKVDMSVKVKDYENYASIVKDVVEIYPYQGHSIKDNIPSIEGTFTESYVMTVKSRLTDYMKQELSTIVFDDFVTLRVVENVADNEASPVLNVKCKIVNDEVYDGWLKAYYPSIWVHTQSTSKLLDTAQIFKGYLLGIAVDFEADFKIPSTNKSRTYKYSGTPGNSDISNVDTAFDAYKVMVSRCVDDFANSYSRRIGMSL